jgi:predicted nucleic acid-binding protein
MVYLFDTNAVSDVMGGNPVLISRTDRLATSDQIVLSPVARGEILFGVERLPAGKKRDSLRLKAIQALALFRCDPITEDIGDRYAAVRLVCRQNGVALNDNDLWIAACAVAWRARLISRDADFQRVPGVDVEDWTK